MNIAEKLSAYLAKIAHKGDFVWHGGQFTFDQRKVFIDTLVAVPAKEADLSVGELKAIVRMMEPPPKADELSKAIWDDLKDVLHEEDAQAILKRWMLHLTVALRAMEEEIDRQRNHIQMHAGDTLSLDNEVRLMRDHWLGAEERVKELEAALRGVLDTNERWGLTVRRKAAYETAINLLTPPKKEGA